MSGVRRSRPSPDIPAANFARADLKVRPYGWLLQADLKVRPYGWLLQADLKVRPYGWLLLKRT